MAFEKQKNEESDKLKDGWRMICPEIIINEEEEKEEKLHPTEKKNAFQSVYDMNKRAVQ